MAHAPASQVFVQRSERVCTLKRSVSRSSSSAHEGLDFLFLVRLELRMSGTPTRTHADTHQHKHVAEAVKFKIKQIWKLEVRLYGNNCEN